MLLLGDPCSKVDGVMHLTQSYLLRDHLGTLNTLEKLRNHFHRPGMEDEVHNFCQRYPQHQHITLRKPALAPLLPLPMIGVPLKKVCMDLVDPLPKSAQGHKHILIINYTTQYPKAVPLLLGDRVCPEHAREDWLESTDRAPVHAGGPN